MPKERSVKLSQYQPNSCTTERPSRAEGIRGRPLPATLDKSHPTGYPTSVRRPNQAPTPAAYSTATRITGEAGSRVPISSPGEATSGDRPRCPLLGQTRQVRIAVESNGHLNLSESELNSESLDEFLNPLNSCFCQPGN